MGALRCGRGLALASNGAMRLSVVGKTRPAGWVTAPGSAPGLAIENRVGARKRVHHEFVFDAQAVAVNIHSGLVLDQPDFRRGSRECREPWARSWRRRTAAHRDWR